MSHQWAHRKKVGVRERGSRSSGWDTDRTCSQVCTAGADLFNQKTQQVTVLDTSPKATWSRKKTQKYCTKREAEVSRSCWGHLPVAPTKCILSSLSSKGGQRPGPANWVAAGSSPAVLPDCSQKPAWKLGLRSTIGAELGQGPAGSKEAAVEQASRVLVTTATTARCHSHCVGCPSVPYAGGFVLLG